MDTNFKVQFTEALHFPASTKHTYEQLNRPITFISRLNALDCTKLRG